jgi:tRNA threonylcarbamoyladenosine biosynthesis protein TsaE
MPATDTVIECFSLKDLEKFGKFFSRSLTKGDVVLLEGDLGAGKTTLVRIIAESLGATPQAVSSPTFSYVHSYDTKPKITHFDLYRLRSKEQFYQLDLDEYLSEDTISFIEWPQIIENELSQNYIKILFDIYPNESRKITIKRN